MLRCKMMERLRRVESLEVLEQFAEVDGGLVVRAPAKINLSLLIRGKRADGFHEIETVMSKVSLYDELFIEETDSGGIEVLCAGEYDVPEGEGNLIYRACRELFEFCGREGQVRVTLTKNIPVGSGLGGGSSDAAAALMGVNRLLKLGVAYEDMVTLGGRTGSDVAFFLGEELAFCTGRGEKICKINKKFDYLALLIMPDISVSTKKVYENYKHDESAYERLKKEINSDINKNEFDLAGKMCANMLAKSCFRVYRELEELKTTIESKCFGPVSLSGSGSTLFCVLRENEIIKARGYQKKLKGEVGCKSVIVRNNRW